ASRGAVAAQAGHGAVVAQRAGPVPHTPPRPVPPLVPYATLCRSFAIDATSGVITVANGSLLDYEAATSHAVTVRVTDQGGLTTTQTFALAVTDVNRSEGQTSELPSGGLVVCRANGADLAQVAGHDPDTAP